MKKISSFIVAIAMIISMAFMMNLSPITAHAAEASVWDGTTITQPTLRIPTSRTGRNACA